MLANSGADLSNSLKQANEFGIGDQQYIATPITYLSDVQAAGLKIAHGLTFMQSWYWDLDEQTRAFAKRFYDRAQRMPNDNQVALYSSVLHYLESVKAAGSDDDQKVAAAMRAAPIHDIFTANGQVREDGRVTLRSLSDAREATRRFKISLGLFAGDRQDPGRRGVPSARNHRLSADSEVSAEFGDHFVICSQTEFDRSLRSKWTVSR